MAVYFFSQAWNYKSGVSASSSGGTDIYSPSKAIDYDMNTYWESNGATPSFVIDLGTAQKIDSLFLKETNITAFKLYHSPDNSNWTEVTDGTKAEKESGIWWWLSFTEVTKRYWKIEVNTKGSGNVKIYELLLMELCLTLADDEDLPSMVVISPKDTIGGSYGLVDGSVTSYAGSKAYSEIDIEFTNLPSDVYDSLYLLFTTPYLRHPLVIIPDDDKPSYIYRCVWADDAFNFKYSQSLKLSGFDGSIKLMEY
jgi:hypothetical protein